MKKIVIEDTIQGRIIRLNVERDDTAAEVMDKLKQRYKTLRELELALVHDGELLAADALPLDAAAADGAGKAPRFELCLVETGAEQPEEGVVLDESEEEEEEEAEEELVAAEPAVQPLATAVDPFSNTGTALDELKAGSLATGAAKLLAVRGLIDPKETAPLLERAYDGPRGFLDALIESHRGLRENVILAALASAAGCEWIGSEQIDPSPEALAELPEDVARRTRALPIALDEGKLVLAVENPLDAEQMEDLQLLCSRPILPRLALRSVIHEKLERAYAGLADDVPQPAPESGAAASLFAGVGEFEDTMVAPPEVQQLLNEQMLAAAQETPAAPEERAEAAEPEAPVEDEQEQPEPEREPDEPPGAAQAEPEAPVEEEPEAPAPADEPELPAEKAREPEPVAPLAEPLRRQATVRYFSQMNPRQNYRLSVSIAEGPGRGTLRLRPVFPGCLCVPDSIELDLDARQHQAEFWITPLAEGELADALLEVRQPDRLLEPIALPAKVAGTFWARLTLAIGLLLPVLGASLEMFGVEVKRASPLARLVSDSGGLLVATLLGAAALIVVSLGLSWTRGPRAARPRTAEIRV